MNKNIIKWIDKIYQRFLWKVPYTYIYTYIYVYNFYNPTFKGKYFGPKIFAPGAKRKDAKILKPLRENTLGQKFLQLERSGRMRKFSSLLRENILDQKLLHLERSGRMRKSSSLLRENTLDQKFLHLERSGRMRKSSSLFKGKKHDWVDHQTMTFCASN